MTIRKKGKIDIQMPLMNSCTKGKDDTKFTLKTVYNIIHKKYDNFIFCINILMTASITVQVTEIYVWKEDELNLTIRFF